MHPLALVVHVLPGAAQHPGAERPGHPTHFWGFQTLLRPPVQVGFAPHTQALLVSLVAGIKGAHQHPLLIRPPYLAVGVGFADLPTHRHGHIESQVCLLWQLQPQRRGRNGILSSHLSQLAPHRRRLCGTHSDF